jgi:hypothetical protein
LLREQLGISVDSPTFRKKPLNPICLRKQYSNSDKVAIPFKRDEDPMKLLNKKILTQREIKYCKEMYRKAERLNVLDR